MRARVTVLDDYQRVALTSADWSAVLAEHDVEVVAEHLADVHELVERLRGSEIVVAMRERTAFPASTLAKLPDLRLLVTTGDVNAAIDVDAAAAQGITVCGTGGIATATAELTIGLMVALGRHIAVEDRNMRAGGWQQTIGTGLARHTLGLLGVGRLGTRVARVARALGMDVIGWSPRLTADRAAAAEVTLVGRDELFARADYLSIHLVLGRRTRGLVGATDLARMRPTAYLINTSRGPIVDEAALLDALRAGAIAGAALDVFDTEPLPGDHPLRTLPNVLLTPHLGYVTTDTYAVFYRDVVADILAWRAGAPVRVIVPRG